MIDLLKLWLIGTEHLSISKIANSFNVSTKQAVRKLKQYEQQGWITYLPGKGRGKKSRITWHKNVEEVVQQNMADPEFRLKILKQMNVDMLSESLVTSIMSQLFSLACAATSSVIVSASIILLTSFLRVQTNQPEQSHFS